MLMINVNSYELPLFYLRTFDETVISGVRPEFYNALEGGFFNFPRVSVADGQSNDFLF